MILKNEKMTLISHYCCGVFYFILFFLRVCHHSIWLHVWKVINGKCHLSPSDILLLFLKSSRFSSRHLLPEILSLDDDCFDNLHIHSQRTNGCDWTKSFRDVLRLSLFSFFCLSVFYACHPLIAHIIQYGNSGKKVKVPSLRQLWNNGAGGLAFIRAPVKFHLRYFEVGGCE